MTAFQAHGIDPSDALLYVAGEEHLLPANTLLGALVLDTASSSGVLELFMLPGMVCVYR